MWRSLGGEWGEFLLNYLLLGVGGLLLCTEDRHLGCREASRGAIGRGVVFFFSQRIVTAVAKVEL